MQQRLTLSLQDLQPQVEMIQRMRAAGRYDARTAMLAEALAPEADLANWVKDALTHYWGGPKLTRKPLMKLQVVQRMINTHDGNAANALRALLRRAVDQVKPEGERRFATEWILYNILELKFLEGRKVREVAMRLAMSEADLYRKQRVAIEAVADAVSEMEQTANGNNQEVTVEDIAAPLAAEIPAAKNPLEIARWGPSGPDRPSPPPLPTFPSCEGSA